jgi:superfamily I DNA and/or RNA helicase
MEENFLVFINGNDKTDSIESVKELEDKYLVKFVGGTTEYSYAKGTEKIKIFNFKKEIFVKDVIVVKDQKELKSIKQIFCYEKYYRLVLEDKTETVDEKEIQLYKKSQPIEVSLSNKIVKENEQEILGINKLFLCGEYCRIVYKNNDEQIVNKQNLQIIENCSPDKKSENVFDYLKEVANEVSVETENKKKLLTEQYNRISKIHENTILFNYLKPQKEIKKFQAPTPVIYPFGLNKSQMEAVKNALSSQISIIQGPPGTGKTQTILNIIANLVKSGKTIAVVSSNNSAIENVKEKLEKNDLGFLVALLGKSENKNNFLINQSGKYPNMKEWEIKEEKIKEIEKEISTLTNELSKMLDIKNRIAKIDQEILELEPEEIEFKERYIKCENLPKENIENISSNKIYEIWIKTENFQKRNGKIGLIQKLLILFCFGYKITKLFRYPLCSVIPYLQNQFYISKRRELENEKRKLNTILEQYKYEKKMKEIAEKSLQLFKAQLVCKYNYEEERKKFNTGFEANAAKFVKEYPVILSTTYSIRNSLPDYVYDYLIVDEASQVDLATGALAFSCSKNIVIVGDLKQLPNVITSEAKKLNEKVWSKYSLDERYNFEKESLLSSALAIWESSNLEYKAPVTTLKEHYRCHPKIINFCNQQFYGGELIIMTQDKGEKEVLNLYLTNSISVSNHKNERQIDCIEKEVFPNLSQYSEEEIGIVTPYKNQISAIHKKFPKDTYKYEVHTVHKFQGREMKAIILSSVDKKISSFADDPRMLNVAVSRAVDSFSVVLTEGGSKESTNYNELERYIRYNKGKVVYSKVYSVFDLLYSGYSEKLHEYLQNHKKVSKYNSENLMYGMIQEVLSENHISNIKCHIHVDLSSLVKDYKLLSEEEQKYARNTWTHVDFLLFNKMDKEPVIAIEVDGVSFHKEDSMQAQRDKLKNSILGKCGITLLRFRTDGSDEKEKLVKELKEKGYLNTSNYQYTEVKDDDLY